MRSVVDGFSAGRFNYFPTPQTAPLIRIVRVLNDKDALVAFNKLGPLVSAVEPASPASLRHVSLAGRVFYGRIRPSPDAGQTLSLPSRPHAARQAAARFSTAFSTLALRSSGVLAKLENCSALAVIPARS